MVSPRRSPLPLVAQLSELCPPACPFRPRSTPIVPIQLPMGHAPNPAEARQAATDTVRTLREAGHEAYFAGGCVRDELLDRHPTDYDVATSARPEAIRALFRRTAEVGAAFGVVLVHAGDVTLEVATFRADGPYTDRRRPDHVEFAEAKADAKRRDFTINALFLDPLVTERTLVRGRVIRGQVVDHVGGLDDLEAGLIRAVGDPNDRLAEDHLRALRAVRFASRLGFTIDEPTAQAIRAHASELAGVSRERIGDELRRMMGDESRALAAWTLQYLGLDAPLLGEHHQDAAPKTLGRLAGSDGAPPPFATCLAAWAVDRGLIELTQVAGLVEHWRRALCLSNEERDALKGTLITLGTLQRAWNGLTVAQQKRTASGAYFTEALRLVNAQDPETMVRLRLHVDQLAATPSGLQPTPLLTGDHLIRAGYAPSSDFATVLALVYDAQLEDRLSTPELALEMGGALLRARSAARAAGIDPDDPEREPDPDPGADPDSDLGSGEDPDR
ncbi:MAG: hypothetical protein EA378_06035 [Phycisphaerales bacterium]|nr:MAG: hypothetical protein EA378_06035 [Phycisphaerales bacterium]